MRKQKYKGRCEKRILSKSDEVCRFYSDLQSKYADKLDSDNGMLDVIIVATKDTDKQDLITVHLLKELVD